MLNMIKADLYRIFKNKGVYITIAIYIALIVLQVVSNASATVGVNMDSIQNENIEYTEPDYAYAEEEKSEILTGAKAFFVMAKNNDNLIYFILPFIVFIIAEDFSHGAIKNLISGGVSRIKYYLTKLILVAAACLIISILNLILQIAIATVLNGFGGDISMDFLNGISKIFLPQTFLVFAYACLGLFLIFTFKRTSVLSTAYIFFTLIPGIIILILSNLNQNLLKLMDYDITSNIKAFGYPNGTFPPDLGRTLLIGTGYILISTVCGILLFRKSEIK